MAAVSEDATLTSQIGVSTLRERAIAELLEASTSSAAEDRVNALEALGHVPTRLDPVARAGLADSSPAVRITAAVMIGRHRLTGASLLVEPLTSDNFTMTRVSALYALRRCKMPVDLTPMASALTDADPRVRAHTAYLMGELGEPSALGPLKEAALDPMPTASFADVRAMQLQIAEARVKLGDTSALHEIRAALFPARDEDLEAATLAAQVSGQIRDRATINELINMASAKDPNGRSLPAETRLVACASLARMGLPQGAVIAREYLADPSPLLRAQAAHVLGQTGRRTTLPLLEPLLDDTETKVRIAAAAACLRVIDGEPIVK